MNWVGLSAIITFYILIFLVGLWASHKIKTGAGNNEEEVMLAGRNIGVLVGVFTMTGTLWRMFSRVLTVEIEYFNNSEDSTVKFYKF